MKPENILADQKAFLLEKFLIKQNAGLDVYSWPAF